MHVLQIIGLILLALFLLICLLAGFGQLTRGTPISRIRSLDGGDSPAVETKAFVELIQRAAGAEMHYGNQIEVLLNGNQTYERLWADMRSARESITLHLYYCRPGRMAEELREILLDRARAGVKVLFLRDAFGSHELTKEYTRSLLDGGIEVCDFRPTHWYEMHKAQYRSHIRVVVVDGRVAWTGGFGIDDKWYGDGQTNLAWRDTNARFTGPAVAQHQAIFVAGWAEAARDLLTGHVLYPGLNGTPQEGGVFAASVHCAPTVGSTAAERLLALTIGGARRTLYISNAYFVPDDDIRRLLTDAARRGVDVRILTAGPPTDTKLTWHASHARYDELLRGGVRIFEYQPSMMHAKTLTADGIWSIAGTMNLDNRSFALNDESVLMMHDAGVAARLEAVFHDDLTRSREIILDEWRRRPLHHRAYERSATLLSRLL